MKTGLRMMAIGLCFSGGAWAQPSSPLGTSPLLHGAYVAPMLSYTRTDDDWLSDDGYGATITIGYRSQRWALEAIGSYAKYGADAGGKDTPAQTLGFSGLIFPFAALPNLYAIAGGGYLGAEDHTETSDRQISVTSGGIIAFHDTSYDDFSAYYVQGGFGHLFALHFDHYDMAIRTEALVRYAERSEGDNVRFTDYLLNIGLQLPFGKTAAVPSAPAARVVPVQNTR